MKFILPVLFIISINCFGQFEKEKSKVLIEANKLYRSEMASWYGTDIFMEKFKPKHPRASGYFSYEKDGKTLCVFHSKGEYPVVLASFAFDSTFSVSTALIDDVERKLTTVEMDLLEIKAQAQIEYGSDTALFKSYKNTNPNFIPLNDSDGKRVYILTGPTQHGSVIIGNDYLLTFNKKNLLETKKALHKNIMSIPYAKNENEPTVTMHSHLSTTGDLITATDLCTIMMYQKYAHWKQHYVISPNYVSIWTMDQLTILTKDAWDKISKDQDSKKEKKN